MIELPTKTVSKWEAGAWKDRLVLAALCASGAVTIAWCAVIARATWWVVEHIVL